MNQRLQATDIVMTVERAKEYLDDAIDFIADDKEPFAVRRIESVIQMLENLQGYGVRVFRAVDLVNCFLTVDCPDIQEIRAAQRNLDSLGAMGRVMACAS